MCPRTRSIVLATGMLLISLVLATIIASLPRVGGGEVARSDFSRESLPLPEALQADGAGVRSPLPGGRHARFQR